MKKSKEIPGFLPEDYDKEYSGAQDAQLDEEQKYWLQHEQQDREAGIALGKQMAIDYDSYIVIGFKKEKYYDNAPMDHQHVCGAYHVDERDVDAVSDLGNLLGEYAFNNPEIYKILMRAVSCCDSLVKEELDPEPPVHEDLEINERFHKNRYVRILSNEFQIVMDEFYNSCGDYKKRRDMRMRMVLTAIADQLHENEAAEIDFFCNFILTENSNGDNVSGIDVVQRRVPCSWPEADTRRARFEQLCKEYNVNCHIVWLED